MTRKELKTGDVFIWNIPSMCTTEMRVTGPTSEVTNDSYKARYVIGQLYPNDSVTLIRAANAPKGRIAKRIIEEMKARNNFGVTDHLLALVTGYPVPSIRRTRGQLVKAGIVVKTGRTSKLAAQVAS